MAPTPKSQARKRKAAEDNGSNTPAKRRTSKAKNEEDGSSANLDNEDPFSFENKEDSHPEPLKNISIERTAFGGVKFSRSPPNASQRYISVEKIAERRGNVSGTLTSPISTPRPSSSVKASVSSDVKSAAESALSTPKSKRGPRSNSSAKSDTKSAKETPSVAATPTSSTRKLKHTTADFEKAATPKEKKKTAEDYCIPPTITDEQQMSIDNSAVNEQHKLLEAGARVYALWNKEYFAAIVCGRDQYSCYYTFFVEDNLKRIIPSNGVAPLAALKNGMKISVIVKDEDGQDQGKRADIVEVPSNTKVDEWVQANFKVKVEDEDDIVDVSWAKIFLTKDQFKTISLATNTTIFVDAENIINESRSSRRSRTTRFSLDSSNVATPQSTPGRVKASSKIAKTPVEAKKKGNTDNKESANEEVTETTTSATPARSGRSTRRSTANTTTPAKTPAKSTPARGRRASARKAKEEQEVVEEANEEAEAEKEPTATQERAEETNAEADKSTVEKIEENNTAADASPANEAISPSKEEEAVSPAKKVLSPVKEAESPIQEKSTVEDLKEADETLEKMEVDEPVDKSPTKTVEETPKNFGDAATTTAVDQVNSSPSKATAEVEQQQSPAVTEKAANGNNVTSSPKSISQDSVASSGPLNGKVTQVPNSEVKTTEADKTNNINDVHQPKASGDKTSSQQIPIASVPAPTTDEEKSIFKDMKFVLTSATRLKKNTDFNKRDYRTKIEERGGTIIDDFSSLKDDSKAYLIADTYYRTHKYLSALSLSIPCVKHDWIYACVVEKKFIDHTPFMLPAGESSLVEGQICEWKPLKNALLAGKRVWVYSNVQIKPDERAISFVDIWSSIIKNLGAVLVEQNFSSLNEKLEFCTNKPIDILLTDTSCEKPLAEKVRSLNGIAVSSEWVIQAIVTGELPDINSSDRFCFDTSA